MKLLAIFGVVLLLYSCSIVAVGSPGIRYALGKSSYGSAIISDDNAFHGPKSVQLSIQKEKYIRLMIYLDEQFPVSDIDVFTIQILPLTGNCTINAQYYFDDGTKSVETMLDSWDIYGISGNWYQIDAYSPLYTLHPDKRLVKIWITLRGNGSCLIDYIKLGGYTLSFEPLEGQVTKKGKPSRISQNGKITYTITYGNDFNTTLTNLVIVEEYDPRMTLLSADPPPDPGTLNVWTIGNVSPGCYGQIVLVMKMEKQNFVADVDGRVFGTGFVSVRRRFATNRDPHTIINNVRISCDQFERRGTVQTPVRPVVGTTLSFSEHGSGWYESEEVLSYMTTKMKMNREFDAVQAPSVLNLSFGRAIDFNSRWYASHLCMDEKRGSIIRERYLYADLLNCTGVAEVRSTRLILDSESNFSGMAIYEIESHTDDRDALITSVFEGSYSLRSGADVYY